MTKALWLVAMVLGAAATAQAQPGGMPDLRKMSGQPLPVAELPVGTITVRVSKQLPMNGVADIEVQAVITDEAGKTDARSVKTGPDGRATLSGLKPGARFKAQATVEGETLNTAEFPVPAQGGARILLIAGLGAATAAEAGDENADTNERFAVMAMTGTVEPRTDLPVGTLEVEVQDRNGAGIAGKAVLLGQVGEDRAIKASKAVANAAGVARFDNLPTVAAGYVAVADIDGYKLGTQPFRLPPAGGMRAVIKALGTTTDPAGLRLDVQSKFAFEPREDALLVYELLVIRNDSGKLFDPGVGGLLIPLPKGFEGVQPLGDGPPLETRTKEGVVLRRPIPPSGPFAGGVQVKFAYFLPAGGESDVALVQTMPFGMERPLFILPEKAHMTLEARGLTKRESEKDRDGNTMQLFEIPDVPVGGTLSVTVRGLPVKNQRGHVVAGALSLLLIIAGVFAVGFGGGGKASTESKARDQLLERREKLFAELVDHEARRPDGEGDALARWTARRKELVTKLEAVYRDIAARERAQGVAPRAGSEA